MRGPTVMPGAASAWVMEYASGTAEKAAALKFTRKRGTWHRDGSRGSGGSFYSPTLKGAVMSKKLVFRIVVGVAVVLAVGGAATYLWVDYSQAQNSLIRSRQDVRSLGENIERHPEDVGRLKEMCSLANAGVQWLEQSNSMWIDKGEVSAHADRDREGQARHRPDCRRRRKAKSLGNLRRLGTPGDAMSAKAQGEDRTVEVDCPTVRVPHAGRRRGCGPVLRSTTTPSTAWRSVQQVRSPASP